MVESVKEVFSKTAEQLTKDLNISVGSPKIIYYIKWGQSYVYKGTVLDSKKNPYNEDAYYVITSNDTTQPFIILKKTNSVNDNEVFDTYAEGKVALLSRLNTQMGTLAADINRVLTLKD